MFTKEHYKKIAEALAKLPANPKRSEVVNVLAEMFAKDNVLFVQRLFIDAVFTEIEKKRKGGNKNG